MRTTLPGETVAQAMRDRFGPIDDWEELGGGEMSQAFAFKVEGRRLIARVGPRREGFDKDAWAARRMTDPAVPVPEVLEVAALDGETFVCVSERMGGTRFDLLEEAARRRTAPAVRAAIDAIASVEPSSTEGYGSFDPETEQASQPTWAAHLLSGMPPDWSGIEDHSDLALVEELTAIGIGIAESAPPVRRFFHGDLTPDNFNADGDRLTGIFDWEAVAIGDPLWDVARLVFWAPVLPSAAAPTFHALERLEAEAAERLRSLVIVNGLWALGFYGADGRRPEMEMVLNRLHGFREEARPFDTGRDYWMRLLPPGSDRS